MRYLIKISFKNKLSWVEIQTFKKYFESKFYNTIDGENYILLSPDDIDYYQDNGILYYTGNDIMLVINGLWYNIEIEEVNL